MQLQTIKSENGFDQNSYLIYDEKTMVLIDCGFEYKTFLDVLKNLHLENRSLNAVILTHTHFDHICSLHDLVANFHCKVYLHAGCTDFLFDKIKNASCYFLDFELPTIETSTFVEVKDQQVLTLGGLTFKIYFTPGHSKCSICILLGDLLFTGDTVLLGSVGRTDLFGGSEEELFLSLKKLEKIPFQTAYPGHGEKMNKEMVLGVVNMFCES